MTASNSESPDDAGVAGDLRAAVPAGRRLQVAVTNPFAWPHVRRGAERLMNDLSRYLLLRGHRVATYAMGPEARKEARDGVTHHFLRQRLGLRPRQFNACHDFAFRLQPALRTCVTDAVFALSYFDAYAALRARRGRAQPYKVVFQNVGIPTRRYFRAVPLDAWFMRTVLRESDHVLVLSRFAQETLQRDFGHEATVIPPPVDTAAFAAPTGRESPSVTRRPTILFVGDADEPRKGARTLCLAYARVRERHGDAELVFSGRASAATRRSLLAGPVLERARAGIRFLGVGGINDLPDLYRSAAVTVLPAVWEAFGLALVESLAAGTPVVGARHGGIPDIIHDDRIGRMFDPGDFTDQTSNVDGLSDAILQVLEMGKSVAVSAACRARAHRFDWSVLGPAYEGMLTHATGIS